MQINLECFWKNSRQLLKHLFVMFFLLSPITPTCIHYTSQEQNNLLKHTKKICLLLFLLFCNPTVSVLRYLTRNELKDPFLDFFIIIPIVDVVSRQRNIYSFEWLQRMIYTSNAFVNIYWLVLPVHCDKKNVVHQILT